VLLCGIILLLCTAVSANETVEVHIPVEATQADCTAALYDSGGHQVQLLELKVGKPAEFVFECTGLMRHTFRIQLTDKDDRKYRYDHTVYTVRVDVFRRSNDELFYTLIITKAGNADPQAGEKLKNIVFRNHPALPKIPTGTLPETGFSAAHQPERVKPPASYRNTGWTLQIPQLSLVSDIVTVTRDGSLYDVSGLGDRAGLLEGYDMPGEGFSFITGHDHLSETETGPFAYLWDLDAGDRIFITDDEDGIRIFEVFANEKIARDDTEGLAKIAGTREDSLTFITCEDELPEGGYANRRIVSARPVN